MKVVIFAGGVGSRLWPLSRQSSPKQLLGLVDNKTLIQIQVERYKDIAKPQDIYISTGRKYADTIRKQVPQLPAENIIAEPTMRDLGPAVAWITAILSERFGDEPTLYVWGDHIYKVQEKYIHLIESAEQYLNTDPNKFVLIGEKARFPSQNLGWITFGNTVKSMNDTPFYSLEGFHYRPDKETAEKYCADGHHAWNMGDFMTTPQFLMGLFKEYAPDLHSKALQMAKHYGKDSFDKVAEEIYPTFEKISMDNAVTEVMDHSNGLVIYDESGWSDVGAWEALKESLEDKPEDNITQGDVLLEDSEDNLVYNFDEDKLVVGIDLEDFIIVNTPDVLMVARKTSVPKIKGVIKRLKADGREDLT